jgi:hypothetical protein
MSVLKLALLVDFQQNLGELVPSKTSCHKIIILENTLNYCAEICGYGNFCHWYNVSAIHLRALSGVGNFTKVGRVYTDCL